MGSYKHPNNNLERLLLLFCYVLVNLFLKGHTFYIVQKFKPFKTKKYLLHQTANNNITFVKLDISV